MKAGSFIDKNAEFQTNRFIDIKSTQHLGRLVPGGRVSGREGHAVTSY